MKPALQHIILHFAKKFFYTYLSCINLNYWMRSILQ